MPGRSAHILIQSCRSALGLNVDLQIDNTKNCDCSGTATTLQHHYQHTMHANTTTLIHKGWGKFDKTRHEDLLKLCWIVHWNDVCEINWVQTEEKLTDSLLHAPVQPLPQVAVPGWLIQLLLDEKNYSLDCSCALSHKTNNTLSNRCSSFVCMHSIIYAFHILSIKCIHLLACMKRHNHHLFKESACKFMLTWWGRYRQLT